MPSWCYPWSSYLLLVVRTGAGNLLVISNILTWDIRERAFSIEGINIKEFGKSGWQVTTYFAGVA